MDSHLTLDRVRGAARENNFVQKLISIKRAVQSRWLAFSFARKFYRQARNGEIHVSVVAPVPDLGERMIVRSLSPRLHALVQLRVAARIASIAQTELRVASCRATGWSDDQVGAALLGSVNATFSPMEQLVLRFADDMTRTPIDVDRQVLRELRSHFSPADLLELTAAIAYENFRTRYVDAAAKLD